MANSVPTMPAAAPAALADPTASGSRSWDDFFKKKFEVNNFFAYYRVGRSMEPGEPWSYANALRDPASIQLRYHSEFRRLWGPFENIYFAGGPRPPPTWQQYTPPRRNRRAKLDRIGMQSAITIQANFTRGKTSLRVRKILGAGGNGLALLCDAESAVANVRAKPFVLKAHLRGGDMREEKIYMKASQLTKVDLKITNQVLLQEESIIC